MSTRRTVSVLLGLAMAGTLLGALAGVLVVMALFFATSARRGDFVPLSWFVPLLGALLGGTCGGMFAPVAAFSPWRHVPIGRLFAHVTTGTVVGGAVVALILPQSFAFVLLGSLLGFLIAGDRVASRSIASTRAAEPHAPAG